MSGVPITLHVIDDDLSVRRASIEIARAEGARIEAHPAGTDAAASLDSESPSCVIVDVTGFGLYEFELLRTLTASSVAVAIIATSRISTATRAVRALKAGALDFIVKPLRGDELRIGIAAALASARRRFERQRARGDFERRLAALSARQREILHHIVLGKPNKVIAFDLGISTRTVEVHRVHIFRRMAVSSAVDLARRAGAFLEREEIEEIDLDGVPALARRDVELQYNQGDRAT